jgi:hypothetical protein
MNTLHLSDSELAMVRNAMRVYLKSFGHNEADVVDQAKKIIAKLSTTTHDDAPEKAELIG